jgi:hypothetical protein
MISKSGQSAETGEIYRLRYRLCLNDGREYTFDLALDASTLQLLDAEPPKSAHWTALGFNQCEHCKLDPDTCRDCPLALSIAGVVERCGDLPSHEPVRLIVEMPARTIQSETTAQRGIGSLIGLLAATSGCPYTRYFRPMACFHLPVATEQETIYRATSMYLLAQYFSHRAGRGADLDLEGLGKIYRDMQVVNKGMARRLRAAAEQDSAVNAIILLDVFAKAMSGTLEESLAEIRPLFSGYGDHDQPIPRGQPG